MSTQQPNYYPTLPAHTQQQPNYYPASPIYIQQPQPVHHQPVIVVHEQEKDIQHGCHFCLCLISGGLWAPCWLAACFRCFFSSSKSLLIQRNGDFVLYHYEYDPNTMVDDNDLATEIAWAVAASLQNVHTHAALSLNAEEIFPRVKSLISDAMKKQESLLYYIRYEPVDETQKLLSADDPKYKYINKIIAVNAREDHFYSIGTSKPSTNPKLNIIRALAVTAHDMYMKYLKESISNENTLNYLLTNPHQILYLSVGTVLIEFIDQGLYTWFRSLVMEHIQQRYHYKHVYGISFSPASTHIHQKDGYTIIGKIKCRLYEYPENSGNYPLKDMVDGQDEISILEKIFIKE